MIVKLIIALAVLAALWTVPPVRARITLIAEPALERLGPVGERLITPAKVYATRNDLDALMRLVAIERNEMRPIPSDKDFPVWARRKWGEPIDRWGTPYWIRQAPRTVILGSNGPDQKRGTEDDITQTLTY
ncbi:MAG TPA: hypothetical protein VK939_04405 [Longimicrobiales bacterium]|nr:hypothetical protein [Longimicrobiales bacterium]